MKSTDDINGFETWADECGGYQDADFDTDSLHSDVAPATPREARPEPRKGEPFVQRYSGVQLPNIGSKSIAINPHLLRSALFGAESVVLGAERPVADAEQPVTLACGYQGWLMFTGPRWGQDHATVLFYLLSVMRGMRLDEPYLLHPRRFAHQMLGWSYSLHSREKLLRALHDLSEGAIVRSWGEFGGSASEVRVLRTPEITGRQVRVRFDSRYEDTLYCQPTYLSLPLRRQLRAGIESWLYQFVRASSCDRTMSLSRLRELFASKRSLAEFGRDLRAALKRLKELGLIVDFRAERGTVTIEKKTGVRT